MTPPPEQERHRHFMKKALAAAAEALARGEFPVGCVIADDEGVLATGSREGSAGPRPSETEHAEIVALRRLNASPASRRENPNARRVLFSTMEPCLMCYGAILLSDVSEIVYAYEDVMGGGTGCDLAALPPLYANRRVTVTAGVCRQESLKLFKRFFADPNHAYWRGSLLADYTLRQA